MNAIEFYFKLLEKKIILPEVILPEDIDNICRFNCSRRLDPDNLRNSLLVEFFCRKGMEEMTKYLLNNLDVVLAIIKKYIDRVPVIFLGIDPGTSLKLLEHNPSWFLSNLDKFYCKAEYRSSIAYSILKDAALNLQNNPADLEAIVTKAINEINNH